MSGSVPLIATAVLGLVLGALPPPVGATPILSVEPASQIVQAGSSVFVDIHIADVTDLFAFQFDLAFEPGLLAADSVTEGLFLPNRGTTDFFSGTIDNTAGVISLISATLIGPILGASGSGTLATIAFHVPVEVEAVTIRVELGDGLLLDSSLTDIPFSARAGTIHVAPMPSTLALFGIGIIGALLLSWMRGRPADRFVVNAQIGGGVIAMIDASARVLVVALLVLNASQVASAAVLDVLRRDGDLILDSKSGRAWLDLTESIGRSYNDMVGPANDCNPLCTTGPFRGFTFAAEADVLQLFSNAGLATGETFTFSPEADEIFRFIKLLGRTYTECILECWDIGKPIEEGFLEVFVAEGIARTLAPRPDDASILMAVSPNAIWDDCCSATATINSLGLPEGNSAQGFLSPLDDRSTGSQTSSGVWLFVRVPQPGAISLLTVGLVAVAFALRRKTRGYFRDGLGGAGRNRKGS